MTIVEKKNPYKFPGKCNTISTGIQLQFKTRLEKLTPIVNSPEIINVEKIRPTTNTITVRKSPAPCSIVVSTVSKIPRPLIQTQQSVLKSAHLVMNLNRINSLNSTESNPTEGWDYISKKCRPEKIEETPMTLEHLLSSLRDDKYRDGSRSTLIKINEKKCSGKTIITNGKTYPALFTPLQLKHLNDRLIECEERRKIEDVNDTKEHYQLQYSSGSEQADEEVRSYMLGSKKNEKPIEERVGSKTVDNDDSIGRVV